jgi:hypothetical protein
MKWIKRYWFGIFLYLGFFMTLWLLLPSQQRYYLHADLDAMTGIGWRITLIAAGALYLLLLILMTVKGALGWGILNALFFVAGLALFFHPGFETATLFLNRQFHTPPFDRRFVVTSMANDSACKEPFYYEPSTRKFLSFADSDTLRSATHVDHWHRGDTINVIFYRGLFGVPWFQSR